MKKLFILFFILLIQNCYSQKKFFGKLLEYSTIYTSYSDTSPLFQPETFFVTQGGDVVNITPEISNDYLVTFGLRKIARFDYENKQNRFYDGSEQNQSLNANYSSIRGLEYLLQYSKGQQQNRKYQNERYFVRYSAKWWSSKIEIQKNGLINLNYKSADLRFRLPIKKLSLSLGAMIRTHKPFGFLPIDNYLETKPWWELAYDYGYMDYYYGIDYDNDGQLDNFDWWWANDEGERIADTDLDFRRNIYQNIVNDYNRTELNKISTLGTLSAVFGLDFYHYRKSFYVHSWANVMPIHKHVIGDELYSYELYFGGDNWLDYNVGFMFGWDISKKLSIFTEYENTRFWDKKLKYLKAGLNYKL
jgi:hypothetical protein